ncbi:SGNH/GDSL hydrolase family protein [Candidatus Woesearchaeota archaeon]|nr:SGNH/GDSL hydrolase family protein [Candidatus Woesearchaeota archaeon]
MTIFLFFLIGELITRAFLYFDKENLEYIHIEKYDEINKYPDKEVSLIEIIKLSKNRKIIYELRPNVTGVYTKKNVKINSRGLRDYEYTLEKPSNTFRIVGIGDSIMFGLGIDLEDTFLKVLERKLNENSNSIKYEVVNFAVPGYNTVMEVETLKEKAIKYNPDLVILSFSSNDMHLPNFIKNKIKFRLDKSYFYDFILQRISHLRQKEDLKARLIGSPFRVDENGSFYEYESELLNVPPEYKDLVGWDSIKRALKDLNDFTSKKDIKVIVLLDYSDNEIIEPYIRNNDYYGYSEKVTYNQEVKKHAKGYKFYWLDPFFGFSEYMNKNNATFSDLIVSEIDHPNERFNQIIGNQLFNFLVENNLVG